MLQAEINDKVLDKQPTILLGLKCEARQITTIVKMIRHKDELSQC
jgi:hypothetical protein